MPRRKQVLVALGTVIGACSIYLWFCCAEYILSLGSSNTAPKTSVAKSITAGLSDSPIPPVSSKIQLATDTKVVFLNGTALITANADGSNVQTLVDDGVSKSDPHWSPTGDRIVYWTSGPGAEDSKILLNLVVISTDGRSVNTIPVLESESGPWLLFLGVDIGWYGNDAVFARGMINKVVGEYQLIDIQPGQVHRYLGDQFGTCEAHARVAVAGMPDRSGKDFVVVNGSPVYPIPSGSTIGFGIHWFADCSHLAFIESTLEGLNANTATLVVVSGNSTEAKIPIPAWMCVLPPVGSSFVIGGSRILVDHDYGRALLYDSTTHTLRHPDADTLKQLLETAATEERVMSSLNGQSPDWYRQEPSSISETRRTLSAPD